MFLEFYGLNDQPFGVTPDPKYLFWGNTHREAMASVYYGIESGCGFVTLIAPPGMGKTTLLFHLLDRLGNSCRTAYIFETQCNSSQLIRYLMADLGCDSAEQDRVALYSKLYELLLAEARAGKRFVLIVDEAQTLDDSVLETVRLLSNFETPNRKLMQVVLAGQPQLSEKLCREELTQLRQRISIMSRIDPLVPPEVTEYVEHRLRVAGYTKSTMFTAEALALIASASRGIPRTINNLCFNALSLGYVKREKTIDAPIVREVMADLQLDSPISLAPVPDQPAEIEVSPDGAAASVNLISCQSESLATGWVATQRWFRVDRALGWVSKYRHFRIDSISGRMVRWRYASLVVLLAAVILAGSFLIPMVSRVTTSAGDATLRAASSAPVTQTARAGSDGADRYGLKTYRDGRRSTQYLTVTVRNNENLDFICRKYLGRSLNQRVLDETLRLNPGISNPEKMENGERVRLPLSWARVNDFRRQGTKQQSRVPPRTTESRQSTQPQPTRYRSPLWALVDDRLFLSKFAWELS